VERFAKRSCVIFFSYSRDPCPQLLRASHTLASRPSRKGWALLQNIAVTTALITLPRVQAHQRELNISSAICTFRAQPNFEFTFRLVSLMDPSGQQDKRQTDIVWIGQFSIIRLQEPEVMTESTSLVVDNTRHWYFRLRSARPKLPLPLGLRDGPSSST
jgi:hypothetical protein